MKEIRWVENKTGYALDGYVGKMKLFSISHRLYDDPARHTRQLLYYGFIGGKTENDRAVEDCFREGIKECKDTAAAEFKRSYELAFGDDD